MVWSRGHVVTWSRGHVVTILDGVVTCGHVVTWSRGHVVTILDGVVRCEFIPAAHSPGKPEKMCSAKCVLQNTPKICTNRLRHVRLLAVHTWEIRLCGANTHLSSCLLTYNSSLHLRRPVLILLSEI